jgi:single-stranded DNA-binding protein
VAVIETYVAKGALIRVDGSLRVEARKDKDGTKHYTTKIVTSDWEHGIYPDPRGAAKSRGEAD